MMTFNYRKELNTFEQSLQFLNYKIWSNTWAIIQELFGGTHKWVSYFVQDMKKLYSLIKFIFSLGL